VRPELDGRRVVLWGARWGDIQFGSWLDRRREEGRAHEMQRLLEAGRELAGASRLLAESARRLGRAFREAMSALQEPARRQLESEIRADLEFGRD
jgi:hypothetical protein